MLSDEQAPYYTQFRKKLSDYSDIALARITKEQEKELENLLLLGITNGEKKSELKYSFMLLTGQFVEKNEKIGQRNLVWIVKMIFFQASFIGNVETVMT